MIQVIHYRLWDCELSQYIYLLPFSTQNNWLANEVKLSFLSDLKVICKMIENNLIGLLFFLHIKTTSLPSQAKKQLTFCSRSILSFLFYLHSKMTSIPLRVQKYWPWQEAFLVFSMFCFVYCKMTKLTLE